MTIKETKYHSNLLNFYISRGLEFGGDGCVCEYFGTPFYSVIAESDKGEFLGAGTVTKINDDFILDAVAVDEKQVGKGIGTALLNALLDKTRKLKAKKIYIVSKTPDFFAKYGFKEIDKNASPNMSCCIECPDFGRTCFPKPMVYVF
ncbi:MAG: GNAT family N-acetyltransferase [Christensenellaceae bacterium]|nr:GNAT family N-acetyltransferase [Christensenellaceae bacterium]